MLGRNRKSLIPPNPQSYTVFEELKAGTHDKSWYMALGRGLNAMAVTAEVCPLRTEIGSPSGKRHYIHNM